jgi:hypothetical protein
MCLFGAVVAAPVPDKPQKFELRTKATLCGVELKPGQYTLKFREDVADIYKGEELIVTAKARIRPLRPHSRPHTAYHCGGILLEVRLEKVKVIFSGPLNSHAAGTKESETRQ